MLHFDAEYEVLRAVLADNASAMPPNVALVWRFRRATLAHDVADDEYREAVVKRWGTARSCQFGLCLVDRGHGVLFMPIL